MLCVVKHARRERRRGRWRAATRHGAAAASSGASTSSIGASTSSGGAAAAGAAACRRPTRAQPAKASTHASRAEPPFTLSPKDGLPMIVVESLDSQVHGRTAMRARLRPSALPPSRPRLPASRTPASATASAGTPSPRCAAPQWLGDVPAAPTRRADHCERRVARNQCRTSSNSRAGGFMSPPLGLSGPQTRRSRGWRAGGRLRSAAPEADAFRETLWL